MLVTLFNALTPPTGESWDDSKTWLGFTPIGEWDGVTTDDNGRVIALDLSWKGLSGELPPWLGNLTNLEIMYLFRNQFSGELPPELGNLANLETLRLEKNRLSGCVPVSLRGQLDKFDHPGRRSNLGGLPYC